jgi:hypothetical protein
MKTKNYFRNAALAVILVLSASFTVSHSENSSVSSLTREKTEFANAGYWIDPVVVTTNTETKDEKLLAGKGYYIEPIVVTYDADKAMMNGQGYYIEPVVVTPETVAPVNMIASN